MRRWLECREFRAFALAITLLAAPLAAAADASWQERIRDLATRALDEHDVMGASVAIVHGDAVPFIEGFGWADREAGTAVNADTLFRVGSITKTLTAIAVMQLVEEGTIDLDDPLAKHLPGFAPAPPLVDAEGWHPDQITVRSLLTHHSGIIGDIYRGFIADEVPRPGDYLELVRGVPAASHPGQHWAYSNIGFTLLGHLVAEKRGRAFEDVIRTRILEPAGMHTAGFDLEAPALSKGYAGGEAHALPALGKVGAGALNASAADMAAYIVMLNARGSGPGGRVLAKPSLEAMWERQNDGVALDLDLATGLGFARFERPTALEIGHTGGTAYFVTVFSVRPESDIGVVVLTNSKEGGGFIADVARRAADIAAEALTGRVAPPVPEPARATDAASRETATRLAGHYQTALGHLHLVPRGKRLRTRLGNQALELRATDRGTYVPHAILLGFIPLRPKMLKSIEIGFVQVGGRDLVFQRGPDGLRAPAGVRIDPTPPSEAWRARLGRYHTINPAGDRIFDGFSLAERDGVLQVVLRGPAAPEGQVRWALEALDDHRALVPGIGRNRGILVEAVETNDGEEVRFSGFRGRLER